MSNNPGPVSVRPASLDTISAQMSRAILDIESIQSKLDGLLAFRWTISGAIGLIAFFGLSICGFVAWSLWNDNSRLITVEHSEETLRTKDIEIDSKIDDQTKWRFKTDQRLESLEEHEIQKSNSKH